MVRYYYHIFSFLSALKIKKGNGENNIMSQPILNNLSGKKLKVAIAQFGSHSQIYRNATGHVIGYGGIFYEELSWISQRLNFSLDMEPSKDNLLGKYNQINGTWSGITGQLQREEVDMACAPYSGAFSSEVVELAVYIVGDAFGIFVKYPVPKIAIDGPIATFSLNVWLGLFFSIIACIGFIHLLNFLARKYLVQTQYPTTTVSNTWFYIFGTLTNHSVNNGLQNGPRSVGLVAFIWLLATFFFVNIYSSCMASYMSLRFQRPEVSTFKDVANNPHYQPTNIRGAASEFIFLDAKSGIMRKIGDKLRQCGNNPTGGCSLSNLETLIENVLGGNYVGILPITVGENYVKKTMSNGKCQLTMGQETMAFINMFMATPKNSPYVQELNKESFWWHSLGLQTYWMNKLMPTPRQCLIQYNKNGESVELVERVRLKLEQFSVAFIVLFIGYVLALIQFIRERFIPY